MRHSQVTKDVTHNLTRLPALPLSIAFPRGYKGIPNEKWQAIPMDDDWELAVVPFSAKEEKQNLEQFELRERRGEIQVEFVEGRTYLDAFLLVDSPDSAVHFLDRFGNPGIRTYLDRFQSDEARILSSLMYSDFVTFQKLVTRAALAKSMSEWKALQPPNPPGGFLHTPSFDQLPPLYCTVGLRFVEGNVQAEFHSAYGFEVWFAVLFFDKAAGLEFRLCQREGCLVLFRVETQHGKKYCSPECAHVAAVRAWRARKPPQKKSSKSRQRPSASRTRKMKGR